jgi:hypothetical protein
MTRIINKILGIIMRPEPKEPEPIPHVEWCPICKKLKQFEKGKFIDLINCACCGFVRYHFKLGCIKCDPQQFGEPT